MPKNSYKLLTLIGVLLLSALMNGCVYLTERLQGNVLEAEQVHKIEVGTTEAEVRSLIGKPLLTNPFNAKEWVYVYQVRLPKGDYFNKHLLLTFSDQGRVLTLDKKNIDKSLPKE